MARKLYDLLGADNRRYSPYCWRIKMALAHKGLEAEDEPCGFTEMEKVAFSGGKTVPVLVDGDAQVRDSWAIAEYLEEAYPEAPSLFGGAKGQALAHFVSRWRRRSIDQCLAGRPMHQCLSETCPCVV